MSDKSASSFELKENQIDYLDAMIKKYDLPDRSKALRILITYAMENADAEESVFTEVRCSGC